jgi:hypothetical protein
MSNSKAYKDGTIRIHYKGERDAHGFTTGNRLSGAKIDRGSWSRDQKAISRSLSARLQKDPDFTSAPNSSGSHGSEIAHARPQSEGGMTDELGAQPASWHFNVGDMAREEGQVELANKLGDNVRMKSTVYMHSEGPKVGTIKARRHKIYIRKDPSSPWGKKFDHLQDGHRGDIDKSEVKTLKTRIENLKADSPDVSLHHKKNAKRHTRKGQYFRAKDFYSSSQRQQTLTLLYGHSRSK